jgi:hypothetical protein
LVSWNSASDGSGTSFPLGEMFVMPADNLMLYAQWENAYTLTYNKNGSSGSAPETKKYVSNTEVAAADGSHLLKEGHTFSHWNTKDDDSGIRYTNWSRLGSLNSTDDRTDELVVTHNISPMFDSEPVPTATNIPDGTNNDRLEDVDIYYSYWADNPYKNLEPCY